MFYICYKNDICKNNFIFIFQVNSTVNYYTITEGIRGYTKYTATIRARNGYPGWGPAISHTLTTQESCESLCY